ncbi:ADP-ribosyltransferase [Nocardiopsis salina]|uniref:ADP-ribosyltransferase n=1 Tax=Nocardiopsis salina TaxID=245836 RepID=UPI0003491D13|nr:ADP-ribosyltransferase [Nocardiopsis salina]
METTWQGLQEHHTAPESETLFAAVEPVVSAGEDLQGDLATVATALEDFAEAAAEARRKLNNLRIEAQSFARDLEDRKFWWLDRNEEEDEWAVQTNFSLKSQVNRAWNDFTSAEIDCANAISGIHSNLVFTNPNDATGADNELVYGEPAPLAGLDPDNIIGTLPEAANGLVVRQLNTLTEWAAEEIHPADAEFENSYGQAAWDTLVVGLGFGIAQGLVTKTGYWHPENGWASSNAHQRENFGMAWKETGMGAAALAGIHNEDGWLIEPSSDDPGANLSWGWWWDNATDSLGQLWEGHTGWSRREEDPEYTGAHSVINTALILGVPIRIGADLLGPGNSASGGGSGSGTGPESGTGTYGGQGSGAGAGSSEREIGDIAEEGRTPITDRLDDALEQTPPLPPATPEGPGAPGGPGGPSEPGGPGAPGGPGGSPGQDPPNQGTGTQEGPRQEPTSPGAPPPGGTGGTEGRGGERGGSPVPGPREGDQSRERPGARDQRDREGVTPPPVTGGGSDAPGDGRGSGSQDREGTPNGAPIPPNHDAGGPFQHGDREGGAPASTSREDNGERSPATGGGGSGNGGGNGPHVPPFGTGDGDQGQGNQGNSGTDGSETHRHDGAQGPSGGTSDHLGTVGTDGIRRFQDTAEAERFANQVLDDPRRNAHAYDNLPLYQQSAVWTYTRNSWLNPIDRLGGPLQQQRYLDDQIERTRELMNHPNPDVRNSNKGWTLYDMNDRVKPTLWDIQDARHRTDLAPVQRELVNDILRNRDPQARMNSCLYNAGYPGHIAESNGGRYPTMDDVEHLTESMDAAVSRPLPEGIEGVRGMHDINYFDGYDGSISSIIGTIQSHPGYISTSIGSEPTQVGPEPFKYKMNLDIPAGAEGLWVGENSAFPNQRELILPRNAEIDTVDARQAGADEFEIDARVVTDD